MKKNKINDICLKLYAPHLCPEPVTESKTALENKLLTEMMYLGGEKLKIRKEENDKNHYDSCRFEKTEARVNAILKCKDRWEVKEITAEENFAAYFSRALTNEYYRITKKEKKQRCSSLDKPVGEDDEEDSTIKDFIKDENSVTPDESYIEKESIKNRLKTIDICWKQAKFPEWYRAVITCNSYEVLHEIFCRYEMNPERYSFIDMEIYNMNEKPKQKDIAQVIGKDPTQLSRALGRIREKLRSLGLASPL